VIIRVECGVGRRGRETPIRLFFGEREIEVAEVLNRWLG